jgi:hypothetical protein
MGAVIHLDAERSRRRVQEECARIAGMRERIATIRAMEGWCAEKRLEIAAELDRIEADAGIARRNWRP